MASTRHPPETQKLSIIIFKGGMKDDKNTRHCALAIDHINPVHGEWRKNMLDIEGYPRRWRPRQSEGRNPEGSALFLKRLPVKDFLIRGQDPWNDRQLRDCIATVAMNNVDDEWNCQSWLMASLYRLVAARFITQEEADWHFDRACEVLVWG